MKSPTIAILILLAASAARAADWPTYRADAARSGYTTDRLPDSLASCWTYRSPAPPQPAWPTSARLHFDRVGQPIVAGGAVLFGTSADDRVVALDLATGQVRWTFFTEGPVRFAPAAWRDRVFVASDDGWLYALALADGTLIWKRRGGLDDSRVLGNGRLISRWPARGGPVVLDNTVYFAAGIWPSDGIYLYALDATNGRPVWTNDRTGRLFMPQPHGTAEAHSGLAPQGYLVASDDLLYVPNGRAVPAALRRADGELVYFHLQKNHSVGSPRAMLIDRFLCNAGCLFLRDDGSMGGRYGHGVLAATPDGLVQSTGDLLVAQRWADRQAVDRKGQPVDYRGLEETCRVQLEPSSPQQQQLAEVVEQLPQLKNIQNAQIQFAEANPGVTKMTSLETGLAQTRPAVEALGARVAPLFPTAEELNREVIVAGGEAICGSPGRVDVVSLAHAKVRWSAPVEGTALGLAVANGRLLVATDRGLLYCFGSPAGSDQAAQPNTDAASTDSTAAATAAPDPVDYAAAAKEILDKTGITEGYCVDLACGDGRLALELARQSKLQIYGVTPSTAEVAAARQRLDAAGLYGTRVTVHRANPDRPSYPPYFADLIVSAESLSADVSTEHSDAVRKMQRPYGGAICLGKPGAMKLSVRGPLEGAAGWTHQNRDAANSLCAPDSLVRGPLTMQWYRDVDLELTDRHAQGPAPLAAEGRLVVEGVDGLCALDAYNGRTLWNYPLPGILKDYDGVHHDVGVGDTGSNYCIGPEGVYVAAGETCLRIDKATGRKLGEFRTPVATDAPDRRWGYLAADGPMLFGTVANHAHAVSPRYADIKLRTESVLLFAMDAKTGELKWKYTPRDSIRHNAIAVADGRVYLIDRPISMSDRITDPGPTRKHLPRLKPGQQPGGILVCLDAATGQVLWRQSDDVFGTQLALSRQHGILLMYYQAVKHNFFRLPSEVGGRMAAFRSADGHRIWDREADYRTRPILNDEMIYSEGGAWNLKSGEPVPFDFKRSYGCGQIAGSTNLMLFRSATLGYLDLTRSAGTENYGGVRPGCWISAIPACGLVLLSDGSNKCACSYPIKSWLALRPAQ